MSFYAIYVHLNHVNVVSVLLHIIVTRSVAYASPALSEYQKRYAQMEKEVFAKVFVYISCYIYGAQVA